jgi:uncharacterized protein (TIGR02246 family)
MHSIADIRNGMVLTMLMTLSILSSQAQSAADEKAIENILQNEDAAWLKGDGIAYSKDFFTDGTFTNIRGEFYTGKKAFEDRHVEIFNTFFKGTTLTHNVASLKFIKPDVAVVETISWVSGFGPQPPARLAPVLDSKGRLVTRLLQVVMKAGGEWKIYAYHNVTVFPGGPPLDPK